MAVNRGLFVRATGTAPAKVGTTPIESRLAMAGLVAQNAPGSPRTGVLAQSLTSPQTVVAAAAGSMVYNVAPCEVVINRAAGEGVYILTVSGSTAVATDPAPGTNSRWDIVYVKQNDTDKGDANNLGVLDVAKGTAAASPTKPSIPTGAVALAEARIYAGTTGTSGGSNTITQLHTWTAARGGAIPVKNLADRQTITAPMLGQSVIRLDCEGWLQRYTGIGASGWEYEGWRRNTDTVTEFNTATNASRQLALINSVKSYARLVNVYGQMTLHCAAVASGAEDVNIAVSAVATQVTAAQGRARLVWNNAYANINQTANAMAQEVAVSAGADVLARLWVEVIAGTVVLTPSFGSYYYLFFDYQPQPD